MKPVPPDFSNRMRRGEPDSRRLASSPSDAGECAAILAALPRDRYVCALDIGGPISILTHQLASRCDGLLSVAISPLPACSTIACSTDPARATIDELELPGKTADGPFDPIVLSEVGCYLSPTDLNRAGRLIRRLLTPAGDFLLVHAVRDTLCSLSGNDVHDAMANLHGFTVLTDRPGADHRLTLLCRDG